MIPHQRVLYLVKMRYKNHNQLTDMVAFSSSFFCRESHYYWC